MKKILITYISCIVIASITWNFIIGQCIIKVSYLEKQSKTGKHYIPYSTITSGTEGFSRMVMDENGYNNNAGLQDGTDIILIAGDSHTEARQVSREKNFCSVAQNLINSKRKVHLYNIGISGNSIADYIYYGSSYIEKFKPEKVIIQVTYDDFTSDAVNNSNDTYIINSNNNFKILRQSPDSKTEKILKTEKDKLPFFTELFIKSNLIFASISNQQSRPFFPEAKIQDVNNIAEYNNSLIDWEFSQIKQIYKDKAAFLYLPLNPSIDIDGSIKYDDIEEESVKSRIVEKCKEYGMDFIDMEPEFNRLLADDKKFPRGFSNTKPGTGHLNEYGHYVTGVKLAEFLLNKLD
jgi:hypothetical protein